MAQWCIKHLPNKLKEYVWSLGPAVKGENRLLEVSDFYKQAVCGVHEQHIMIIIIAIVIILIKLKQNKF